MEQFQFGEPLGARESQPVQQSALETVKWSSTKFDATQLNKQIHFSDCSSTRWPLQWLCSALQH